MKNKIFCIKMVVYLLSSLLFIACGNEAEKKDSTKSEDTSHISGELIIFHAGSLSVPFKEISSAFNQEYPDLKISMEAAGSVACARKITDLKRKCDVFGSADYNVIDKMLIPEYASWNIKFVSNEMAIVYTEKSKYHDIINIDSWTDILLKEDVYYGRSDPNSDPCGYRSVLTMKLAEKFYEKPDLAKAFLNKDMNFIRPKEVDLIALLETNSLDYIFLYRSVAEQHGLEYLLLPDHVNLKNPEFANYYSTVSVDINGKKPGETITQTGEPMVYGITIPKNAPNPKAAKAFVNFVLSKEKGMAILEKNGQPSLVPAKTNTYKNILDNLKKFAIE
ncbi:MAG: tungstate ABC transporter substrate-binding protein WtpA [Bacteroidales bacterium]|nr:tungstate ABC transporter substrate-binding protein WtpA [Bacteroidales bacterium]